MRVVIRGSPDWEYAWSTLQMRLCETTLKSVDGGTRVVGVGEFMLMLSDDRGFHFKHRNTRNYVSITHDGELKVYETDVVFHRGVF